MTKLFLALISLILMTFSHAAAKTSVGDEIFAQRYPGAKVFGEAQSNFDRTIFYTGPMEAKFVVGDETRVEGSVRMEMIEAPGGRSIFEVYRAYDRAIADLGYTPVFTCEGLKECGGQIGYLLNKVGRANGKMPFGDDLFYGVFERVEGRARAVLQIYASGDNRRPAAVYLEVVSSEAEEQELEILRADEIGAALDESGAAAIYGLEFALDSADLLPASQPVLEEMAALLKSRPGATMLLVGHTDNQGALDYNLDLSRRRADAVRVALEDDFGVIAGRLETHGVGFLAPRASQDSDAGRARNRRVELVIR